jgi:hypothetical protein
VPHTLSWRDFVGLHGDVGRDDFHSEHPGRTCTHTHILLDGDIAVGRLPRPLEIELFVDGQLLRRQRIGRKKRFSLRLPLNAIAPGDHELKIVSNVYSVPNKFLANGDFRPLSFRVTTTYIDNRQVKNEDNERNISWRQRAWQV